MHTISDHHHSEGKRHSHGVSLVDRKWLLYVYWGPGSIYTALGNTVLILLITRIILYRTIYTDSVKSSYPDNIDMLGQRGHNVDGSNSLHGPNFGNPHRPNVTLLAGSTWNQHDGSTSVQRVVKCRFHVIPTFLFFSIHSLKLLWQLIFIKCCMCHHFKWPVC